MKKDLKELLRMADKGVSLNVFPLVYANQIGMEEHVTFTVDDWLPAETISLIDILM